MSEVVQPREVLKEISSAIPTGVHQNVTVIGSLAAAYWLFDRGLPVGVRTKDVDSVLAPRRLAPSTGRDVAETLLAAGWKPRPDDVFGAPGDATTPDEKLPALRLTPPQTSDWFLELLTEPETGQDSRRWLRFVLKNGDHYGLPSFRFTGIATHGARLTEFGFRVAVPEMMALANLLEHPRIKPERIGTTGDKRSNKDLGRVLAVVWLAGEEAVEEWPRSWIDGPRRVFPDTWRELGTHAGDGIRALVASPSDLQQATTLCNNGLLASRNVTAEQLKATAERFLGSAIEEMTRLCGG